MDSPDSIHSVEKSTLSRWNFELSPIEKRRNPIGSRLSFHIVY